MNFTDVRLFEFIPDADAFIHLSVTIDLPIGDPRIAEMGKRGRAASILSGNSIGRTRIYGDPSKFLYDNIFLEVRENIGGDKQLDYTKVFEWLTNEFPSHTKYFTDKVIKDFEGRAYTKRTHTITLADVDALKFRLMFSCSTS